MEDASRHRLTELFPDIADDLASVIPDGCHAVRFEDAWFSRKYTDGSRLRTVDLARPVDGPALEALADAGRARARKHDWRQIHRDDDLSQDVFRRHVRQLVKKVPQFLRIWPAEVQGRDAKVVALRVDFETGWVRRRLGAIVGDRMIHELVRKRWELAEPERSVRIETLYDLRDPSERALLRETMELPLRSDMPDLLRRMGLAPADSDARWVRRERYTKGELTTAVSMSGEWATVVIELDRSARLR